ncbi:MAG: DUF364 domain-containing protein [Proteobacteria bacterium]|nr:DUF364 domain-containing protein [Pseudomonadota bacterium]
MPEPANHSTQLQILKGILADLHGHDAPLTAIAVGSHMVAVSCDGHTGLATRQGLHGHDIGVSPVMADLPASGLELAGWLVAPPEFVPQARSLGLAAVNALLPQPCDLTQAKGQDLILKHGTGRNVAVVGHFPFVVRMGPEFARLSILELSPRAGDLPAAQAKQILPEADVVALTGTTLLNGTLAGLLALCRRDALVLMLGPSTPFAQSLFSHGLDVLAGARVVDADSVRKGILEGRPFKSLTGANALVWQKR